MTRIVASADARLWLIEALTKLSSGALTWIETAQFHSTLLGARGDIKVAERYVREALSALLAVNRELAARHSVGCACIDCRNKVM